MAETNESPQPAADQAAAKKTSATRSTAKKTTGSKSAAKKTVAKKAAAKKSAAKKSAAKKSAAKKSAAKKSSVGKTAATRSPAKAAAVTQKPQAIVADPAALRGLADKVLHSESGRSGPVGEVVDELKTLGRLVAAYARGDYRDIPLDSLLMVIAGLVYVASPIDLIPDAIPVAGHLDDVVAVGLVIRQVHHELAAFREWEAKGSPEA